MARLRLGLMLAGLGWRLAQGLWTLRSFARLNQAQRDLEVRDWSQRMLAASRTELRVRGSALDGACMLAINHVSWLDIIGLNAAQPTRFVAKADVDAWPVIGHLARSTGTLFIERERPRDAMRVMHDMAAQLRSGHRISVFPEGTTSDGSAILPLHANLFQAAVSANAPVQPVLLRYVEADSGCSSLAPAYVGDDSVIDTLRRIAAGPRLALEIHYLEPVHSADRRELAALVRDRLQQALEAAQPVRSAEQAALQLA